SARRRSLGKVAPGVLFVIRNGTGRITKMFLFGRKELLESVFVDRLHKGFVSSDNALLKQPPDRVIHELHSLRFSGNDHILKFLSRSFANDRRDRGIGDQDFIYRNTTGTADFLQQ